MIQHLLYFLVMTTVHIVGGGVSGLALATALPAHWEVHLYEQSGRHRRVPTLFGLQPSGLAALAELGLAQEVTDRSAALASAQFQEHQGPVLRRIDQLKVRLIAQTDLLDLLTRRLPTNVRMHRQRLAAVADLLPRPDSSPRQDELIVGADGVHSVVRAGLWPARSAPPRRLGVTVIRGVIDEPWSGTSLQEIWRDGGLFGLTPRPGQGVNWFATIPRQRFIDEQQAIDALRARWSACDSPAEQVLHHATAEQTLVNDLWQSRWPGQLVRGHAVLIGDAAHAMAPNLGRGANESLVDAVVLGRALRTRPLPAALRAYQRRRLVSAQLVKGASRALLRLSSTRHEPLRNRALRPLSFR